MTSARHIIRTGFKALQFALLTLVCFWVFACQASAAPAGETHRMQVLGVGTGLLALAGLTQALRHLGAQKCRRL